MVKADINQATGPKSSDLDPIWIEPFVDMKAFCFFGGLQGPSANPSILLFGIELWLPSRSCHSKLLMGPSLKLASLIPMTCFFLLALLLPGKTYGLTKARFHNHVHHTNPLLLMKTFSGGMF